ncbi:MAG: ABC-F family ATP-binding cassette domain-containing protein [Oscillospiraceae bacterium]
MILEANGIALSFGADVVLKNVTFQINEAERVGLVGYNGCGKTTLLNIITGELEQTEGTIALKNNATVGYLKQTAGLNLKNTVYSEMKSVNNADVLLARMKELELTMGDDHELVEEYERVSARYEAIDGYHLDYNIKRILNGMAFAEETHSKSVAVLSGGEKTRLALSKLLILSPDLLILDEPTNHLDIDTIEWLEKFLLAYRGSILIVSHDRYFLDRVTTRTLEIQNGKSKLYNGNFSAYMRQKEENDAREETVYKRTAAEADKLREYAERNMARASTSNMAKSRLKMLDRLDLSAPENAEHTKVKFRITPLSEPYKDVVVAKNLGVAVGKRDLIKDLSFTLLRGERLAIIGANGTGKTTLLKTLLGKHPQSSGKLIMGGGVKASCLEQNLYGVRSKNPLEYIWDLYPSMSQLEVRSLLASVGFRGEEIYTDSKGLSGGELARLNMARIALEHPNLLILDEPTNHLDIYTKDVLCDALRVFDGTMIVVTHDRYLMELLDSRILLLDGESGVFFESYGQYQEYRETGVVPPQNGEAKRNEAAELQPKRDELVESTKAVINNQKEIRKRRAEERERKSVVEKRIDLLEGEIYDLQSQLELPEVACDHEKLGEICAVLEKYKAEMEELTDEWLENYAD